jgi:hypothetical protein
MMGAYSTDGGATWKARVLGNGSDGIPGAFSDPWTAWDNFGNLFISYIHAENSNLTVLDVAVDLSTDGGKTFKNIFTKTNIFDHPELTVGNGTVWVTYADNLGNNNVAIAVSGAPVTSVYTQSMPATS